MTHTSSRSATCSSTARSYSSRFITCFSFKHFPFIAFYCVAHINRVAFTFNSCTCRIIFRGTCTFIKSSGSGIVGLRWWFGTFGPLSCVQSNHQRISCSHKLLIKTGSALSASHSSPGQSPTPLPYSIVLQLFSSLYLTSSLAGNSPPSHHYTTPVITYSLPRSF